MSVDNITGNIVPAEFDEPDLGLDIGPPVEIRARIFNENVKFISPNKGKTVIDLRTVRTVTMTGSDGNPDQLLGLQVRDGKTNTGYGRLRVAHFKIRTYAAESNNVFLKGLEVEIDNRGTVSDFQSGIRIGMKNVPGAGDTLANSRALEIEMGEQGAPTGYHRAIDLRHNDPSNVTVPTAIVLRADRTTNGFAFAIDVQQYGLDLAGAASAASAFAKLVDDGQNADLASAVVGNATGVIKVVVGSTVGYIPMYASYTPA